MQREFIPKMPGMYITDDGMYILSDSQNDANLMNVKHVTRENEEMMKDCMVSFIQDGENIKIAWDNKKGLQGFTLPIMEYIRQISDDQLLNILDRVAKVNIQEKANVEHYKNELLKLLKKDDYKLPELVIAQTNIQNNNYKMYFKRQYGHASLYLEAAKQLGEEYYQKLITNPYFNKVLYDMSFDYMGNIEQMENELRTPKIV